MALQCKAGTIGFTSTSAAGTVVTTTSIGFTPKALICWYTGRATTTDTDGTQDVKRGFSFALGPTNRVAFHDRTEDNTTTANYNRAIRNDSVVVEISDAAPPTVTGLIDINTFSSDTIEFIIDDQLVAGHEVNYMAIGGSDLTNFTISSFTDPGTTGTYTITAVGFQPDCILISSVLNTENANTTTTGDGVMVGLCTAPTTTSNFILTGRGQDNAATSVTGSYCRTGECVARQDQTNPHTTVNARATINAFHATGFDINWLESISAGGGQNYYFLALKGGRYTSGSLVTSVTLGATITASVGFSSSGLMFFSAQNTECAADTPVAFDKWSVGGANSPTSRNAAASIDENARPTMDSGAAVNHNGVYLRIDDNATAVVGIMDLETITSTGFNAIMDDGDTAASFVFWLAMTSDVVAGGAAITLEQIERHWPRGVMRGVGRGIA